MQDSRRLLDLYDAGAAVVTVAAPAEELAARIRAIVRRLRPSPLPNGDLPEPPDPADEVGGRRERRARRAAAARAAARAGGIMSLALVLMGSAEAVSSQPGGSADNPPRTVVSQS
jgi:hypothetical protein